MFVPIAVIMIVLKFLDLRNDWEYIPSVYFVKSILLRIEELQLPHVG